MVTFENGRFCFSPDFEKEFFSAFAFLSEPAGEVRRAERWIRQTGAQIASPAAWLDAWLQKADRLAAAKKAAQRATPLDLDAVRAALEARAARDREAWLKARGLDRPPGCPGELYVQLLRNEILHMVKKGARA